MLHITLYLFKLFISLWMQVGKNYGGFTGNSIIHDPDLLVVSLEVGLATP